jgi:hypothetical protein
LNTTPSYAALSYAAPLRATMIAACGGLMACTAPPPTTQGDFNPVYNEIETRLLDGDLVNIIVSMTGARTNGDVENYARCGAAQYALIRGYGFARHVRTNVTIEGGISRADAVYTISSALPDGLRTIDAEVTVQNCASERIPTV